MPDFGASIWLPILLGAGGAAAGGLAGKAGQKQTSTSNQSGTQSQTTDMLRAALEPEYFDKLRQTMAIPLMSEISRAMTKPIYGDADKAKFMGDLNSLTADAMKTLRGTMAGMGALDSGRATSAATDLMKQRVAQTAGFFRDLPFKEEEARAARLNPLLQMGLAWTGKPPVSEKTTGTVNGNWTSTGTNTQEQAGMPFWSGFMNNLSGIAGGMLGGMVQKGSIGKPKTATKPSPGNSSGAWGSNDWGFDESGWF